MKTSVTVTSPLSPQKIHWQENILGLLAINNDRCKIIAQLIKKKINYILLSFPKFRLLQLSLSLPLLWLSLRPIPDMDTLLDTILDTVDMQAMLPITTTLLERGQLMPSQWLRIPRIRFWSPRFQIWIWRTLLWMNIQLRCLYFLSQFFIIEKNIPKQAICESKA